LSKGGAIVHPHNIESAAAKWYNGAATIALVIQSIEVKQMEATMTAIELTGTINEQRQLELDGDLPISGPMRVRVIVLYSLYDEWDESEWLQAAASNPAFDFLQDQAEDIYTLADGEPFDDQV
jgi:hypothetical protein